MASSSLLLNKSKDTDEMSFLDDTEVSLGISLYFSNSDGGGFSGVTKARYSDFCVHEIAAGPNHHPEVARLTSLDATIITQSDKGNDNKETLDSKPEATITSEPQQDDSKKRKREETVDWDVIQKELGELVGETSARNVVEFLQATSSTTTEDGASSKAPKAKDDDDDDSAKKRQQDSSKSTSSADSQQQQQRFFVLLPAMESKQERKTLHQYIKNTLASCAMADTVDGGRIRIWHQKFRAHMPNAFDNKNNRNNNRKQQRAAPKDKPYLRFVLYKENIDTGAALHQIQQRLGTFGGGGNRGGGRGGRGGGRNRHQQQRRIRMGYAGNKDKRGVTTQFITVPASTSVQHLVNVFNNNGNRGGGGHTRTGGAAVIRVGNFCYTAHELKLGSLAGNRFTVAIRNIQGYSNKQALQESIAAFDDGYCFINYFGTQRFGKYHDTHLTGMAILQGDYETAIDIIMRPKQNADEKERHPEIHAARQQWRDRFQNLSDKKDTNKEQEERATVERKCAEQTLKHMNRFMNSEIAILKSLIHAPLDYKKAFSCITKTMRMMFIHAFQSFLFNKVASFRIATLGKAVVVGDLVLASSSNNDSKPAAANTSGIPNVKVVTHDDVTAQRYTMEDVVLPLLGSKTRVPENASGEHFAAILKEHGITHDMISRVLDRDFHSAGDYRKVICRSTDVEFDIFHYKDELQPLLQTDYMKLNGIQVEKAKDDDDDNGGLLGMVVSFSLPSSSYATIFLRELMKRPTSTEYQRELKLGAMQGKRASS